MIKILMTHKKAFLLITLLLVCTLAVTAVAVAMQKPGFHSYANADHLIPTNYTHASYAVDINNPRAYVGFSDYVFAGKIISEDGTEHDAVVGYPYTNYSVQVLDNIKRELVLETIPVKKSGGLDKDGKSYTLLERDSLPDVGSYYIFFVNAQNDGSILLAGEKSNILLSLADTDKATPDEILAKIRESEEYQLYKEAAANQIPSEFAVYNSKYDVNAAEIGIGRSKDNVDREVQPANPDNPEVEAPAPTASTPVDNASDGNTSNPANPPSANAACYAIDIYSPREVVGFSNYTFVGKIISNDGVANSPTSGNLCTNYSVQVLDNIKNQLVLQTIPIRKLGAEPSADYQSSISDGNVFPEVGRYYIFMAEAQVDGSLIIGSPTSNILLPLSGKNTNNPEALLAEIRATSEYQLYLDAYHNQVIRFDNQHFTSIYDANRQ